MGFGMGQGSARPNMPNEGFNGIGSRRPRTMAPRAAAPTPAPRQPMPAPMPAPTPNEPMQPGQPMPPPAMPTPRTPSPFGVGAGDVGQMGSSPFGAPARRGYPTGNGGWM